MAAYAIDITVADLNSITESWSNVNDKIQLEKLFVLLVAEFQSADDDGLAGYGVTAGLQASLEGTLANVSNALRVEFLKKWITYLFIEFTAVAAGDLAYEVTTSATKAHEEFLDYLNQSISYMSDSERKISFHAINALINTEFGLMEAAS